MAYYFFVWTSEIIEHLAEHGVTPEEFEEVVSNPEYEDISRSSGMRWRSALPRPGDIFAVPSNVSRTI